MSHKIDFQNQKVVLVIKLIQDKRKNYLPGRWNNWKLVMCNLQRWRERLFAPGFREESCFWSVFWTSLCPLTRSPVGAACLAGTQMPINPCGVQLGLHLLPHGCSCPQGAWVPLFLRGSAPLGGALPWSRAACSWGWGWGCLPFWGSSTSPSGSHTKTSSTLASISNKGDISTYIFTFYFSVYPDPGRKEHFIYWMPLQKPQ